MMQNDRYTKTLLTVIAVCLLWLCAREHSAISSVHAGATPQEVIVVGVRLASVDARSLLPVSIQNISVPDPYSTNNARHAGLPIYGKVKVEK